MKYFVNGLVIHSENAAKPPERASLLVTNWLDSQPNMDVALDYGCGKLRYASILSKKFRSIHFVDSEIQLYRKQTISGQKTSVSSIVREKYPSGQVHSLESGTWRAVGADLVICTNVLSAIPYHNERLNAIQNIKSILKPDGKLFICVQYRNSHYTAWENKEMVRLFEGGFLIPNGNSASYYACINLPLLQNYVTQAGLSIITSFTAGQTAVVIAGL